VGAAAPVTAPSEVREAGWAESSRSIQVVCLR
jgi:hypothetical protein